MRNLWLKYTLYRLGLFAAITVALGLIGIPWLFASILGAMFSFAISMIWLSKLRDELSKQIYAKRNKPKNLDEVVEDELENDSK